MSPVLPIVSISMAESLKKQGNAMKESLRELRTNIRFCGDDIKTILFTSVMPNEGKSTVVMDLARSLVQAGNRVLVIDTDMRKSVLVGRYKVKREDGGTIYGLSHLLSGQRELVDVVYETQSSRLMAIFAGPAVVNPTELLENKYFTKLMTSVRKLFDYILVDCAPLGAAIDAAVVAKERRQSSCATSCASRCMSGAKTATSATSSVKRRVSRAMILSSAPSIFSSYSLSSCVI